MSRRTVLSLAVAGAAFVVGGSFVPVGSAATFSVTTTADSGAGSLRQAILDANANAGSDTIRFAIPGAGAHTIAVTSGPLPVISDPVVVDGTTQAGFAGTPLIRVDNATGNAITGLNVTADGSRVRGLELTRFGAAIRVAADG